MEIKKLEGRNIPGSVPITNNPAVLNHLVNDMIGLRKEGRKNLFSDIRSEMERVFGPSNRGMRLEFMTRVWKLEYRGLHFNIFSAKSKGTSIEICGYDYEEIRAGAKEKEIIEFTNKLEKLING